MHNPPVSGRGKPRWEYVALWRYGPLGTVLVGLALISTGASGLCATSISLALIPIGFVCFIAGVALPRLEGGFTAGPQGISGRMLAVHDLDTYTATGQALIPRAEASATNKTATELVRLGDVWDTLDAAGFRPFEAAGGTAYLVGPDGRKIVLPSRHFSIGVP